jgi:histidinol-phosphate/aromatic aminotransferase/cobyric acid decarboxylase-like protein
MNIYGIKNCLRISIGKSDENKKLILRIKKAINV